MYFTNIKYWCLYLLHDNKWYNCYSYAKIENLSRDIRFCYPGDILENLGFSVTIKLIQTALGEQKISMCT